MERLQQLMNSMPGGMGSAMAGGDAPTPDCAEKVHVSSLALLKRDLCGQADFIAARGAPLPAAAACSLTDSPMPRLPSSPSRGYHG